MIRAAIAGLGWWGRTLVESLQGRSDSMRFVAGATRTVTPEAREYAKAQGFELLGTYQDLLDASDVDAVVLATPHSMHVPQIVAAARAGKHVYCEKPLALSAAGARTAVAAMQEAGKTLGLGYNRRFHPVMADLRERISTGALGTLMHFEGTMTFPAGLYLKPGQWRADRDEAPCGGLTPLGVHMVDAAIDLFGEVEEVYCQSMRRVVQVDCDDTTSVLFRMKNGMSGYLGTLTATGGGLRLQVYGSGGWLRMYGVTNLASASSQDRRSRLFGECTFQPVTGEAQTWQAGACDTTRAALEAFATAAQRGAGYPIAIAQMLHGASVTEAIIRSAATHRPERVA